MGKGQRIKIQRVKKPEVKKTDEEIASDFIKLLASEISGFTDRTRLVFQEIIITPGVQDDKLAYTVAAKFGRHEL